MAIPHSDRHGPGKGYIIAFAFMLLLSCALDALCLYTLLNKDISLPDDCETVSIPFIREEDEQLYAEGFELPFEVNHYGTLVPDPAALCTGESYQVIYRTWSDRYYVEELRRSDGTPIFTHADERRAYHEDQDLAGIACVIAFSLGAVYWVLGIIVTLHPERYSHRVLRLFYKESELR